MKDLADSGTGRSFEMEIAATKNSPQHLK